MHERKVKVKSLSRVRLLATPWTAAHQAPLSLGFSRQEYWSGVPLPCPIKKLSAEELMLLNCGVEKTLENLFNCKEIQPVHSKGDQFWVFIGRTDAEAETPIRSAKS